MEWFLAGIVVLTTGWTLIDPFLSVVVGLLIMRSSWRLAFKVFHVLLEGTPEHIDAYKLCSDIEDVEGVTLIHDIHIWTITSGRVAVTAHIVVDPSCLGSMEQLRSRIQDITHDGYNIGHMTIQLEQSTASCLETHHVGHLMQTRRTAKT